MTGTTRILTLAVAVVCFIPLREAAACNDYDVEFEATPSFLAPSTIKVHADNHSSNVSVVIGDDKLDENLPLNAAAAEDFCERFRQALAIDQSKDTRLGLDGIGVRGHWRLSSSPPYEFSFWSPDREKSFRETAARNRSYSRGDGGNTDSILQGPADAFLAPMKVRPRSAHMKTKRTRQMTPRTTSQPTQFFRIMIEARGAQPALE